jgi:adenylosuccinate synthase
MKYIIVPKEDFNHKEMEDILFEKYQSRLKSFDRDEYKMVVSIMGKSAMEAKALEWMHETLDAYDMPWVERLNYYLNFWSEDDKDDDMDEYAPLTNEIVDMVLSAKKLMNMCQYELAASICMEGAQKYGLAFPIDFRDDIWMDIDVFPLSDNCSN